MVASCLRRMGSYQRALKVYEEVNVEDPTNIECLRFLVQICKEMQLPYEHHAANLNKLLRMQ
jgi:intraflagellar transport protein 88